ncbi:hypothetical protein [Yoonia sp. I 8.24]|uniref:hypothetical protein n=1 Tax=Yoonia sp. I 8.24 TaxID=1537229 RepID=UPI001EDF37D5|nr:hypothetical protein [Yoonia sp. I 8.24]MCG3266110.1 hypothetical protein [Yoonia sp. I 8.24]
MSLTMMALRIAAVEALKLGGTLVGTNVLDSQISAIDQTADGDLQTDQQRPFIAVYSDTSKASDLGNTGLRTNGQIELTFNCGVSLTMGQTNKETGVTEIIEGLPSTDAQFEAILDVVGCQICRVLTDPSNPWSQVFGDLCTLVSKAQVRSSSAADGVRLACGQIKLTVEAYADPPLGQVFAPDSHWLKFLALMAQNGVAQAGLFELMLGQANTSTDQSYEALTGMTTRDARSLALYAMDGVPAGVVVASPISVEDRG